MNTSNNKPNRISEADVDSLLTNFFVEEMPAEFRQDHSATKLAANEKRNSSTRTVWTVLATTAAALMFAVIVFQSTTERTSDGLGDSFAKTPLETPLIPTDTSTPVTDRIETEEGTVEMKTWLTKEQDTESGMDLTGFHFEYDIELEPDDAESDDSAPQLPEAAGDSSK